MLGLRILQLDSPLGNESREKGAEKTSPKKERNCSLVSISGCKPWWVIDDPRGSKWQLISYFGGVFFICCPLSLNHRYHSIQVKEREIWNRGVNSIKHLTAKLKDTIKSYIWPGGPAVLHNPHSRNVGLPGSSAPSLQPLQQHWDMGLTKGRQEWGVAC